MSWPGGIYNAGFTKQWLNERDKEATAGGQDWVAERIKAGDKTCEANQDLRSQNIDFQKFSESLEFRPQDMDARDLSLLVKKIKVPVYLSGAWQDEQTGPRFATMLGNFTQSPDVHFVLFNGHHPDGYLPINLTRWAEFLQLYVGQQVPHLPDIVRAGAPALFKDAFKEDDLNFGPDRFADLKPDQYDAALARWKADPQVTVRYEMGDGDPAVPGKQLPRYEATFDSWPPKGLSAATFYLGDKGSLSQTKPTTGGVDKYQFDPAIGKVGYASKSSYDFQGPMVDLPWKDTAKGKGLSYLTEPLAQDTTIAGPGYADLWFKSDATDANIEVVLSEVDPDGTERRLQNGLLRAGDRKVDEGASNEFQINESFTKADYQPLPKGEFTEVKVPIFPVSAVLRKGSRLRVQINTPGGDLPYWFFDNSDYGNPNANEYVAHQSDKASSVVLPTLPVGTVVPTPGYAPCPSLRGMVCRPYHPLENAPG
jgi:predicted acyl esterase